MNKDNSFTTVGDEPIEARIVAWVLGEASTFEAAELERLCAERPELLVFRRRMIALHGLLTEAETAQPADSWKLSPEKRKPLDEISGQEKVVRLEDAKEKRIRRAGLKAFFAIAACVVLAIVVLQLVHPIWIRSKVYSSAEKKSFLMATGDVGVMDQEEAGLGAGAGAAADPSEFKSKISSREVNVAKRSPLTTPLPPELIEGTPKPINVPNLETPVNGPAGHSSMAQSKKKSEKSAPSPSENEAAKDIAADPFADDKSDDSSLAKATVSPATPAPSSPRPRMIPPPGANRVFAEGAASSFTIPDPGDNFDEISALSSLDGSGPSGGLGGSGGAKGAGKGWGGQDGRDTAVPASGPEPSSTHSIDGKVPTLRDHLTGFTGEVANDGKDSAHDKVPILGDVPVVGKLLSDDSEKKKELQLPIITTRSVGDDFDGTVNYGAPIAAEAGKADQLGPLRTNPALTFEHQKKVDDVRRSLYKAEGNINLGKYDEAKKEYENTLRADPYNVAARRGLEKVASAKSAYYRAAYDHTRAELLAEVDKAWELSVPADKEGKKANVEIVRESKPQTELEPPTLSSQTAAGGKAGSSDPAKADAYWDTSKAAESGKKSGGVEYELHTGYSSQYLYRGKDLKEGDEESNSESDVRKGGAKSDLAEREMVRRQSTFVESDKLLVSAREAYASNDFALAYEKYEKALNLLPDAPMAKDRRDFLKTSLSDAAIALAGKSAKGESNHWLNKALEWDPNNEIARKRLVVDATSEISAAEDPYSTFSLNISDASFKVAQAALAKGERPDPAGIKVEQFYNAVDYGDPSPQNGQPVAVNIEQSAHPVIPGRNLVRVALKTAAAGRSAAQPLRLTLLVDQSGSMVREDRRAAMDKALASLAGLLTKNDLVTVIGFSRTPRLLASGMTGDQAGKLKDLANQAASEGGTNLEWAMNVAAKKAMEYKTAGAQNRIVLFTDGAANLGDADPVRLAEKVKSLRQSGIAFDIAGSAADELNDDLLGELARNGNGRYYVVGKGDDQDLGKQLAGAFRPAAENVKVQVQFNPQRVSRYKLIGFEKDRLKTEDFRNDAVDAAELAAEEAGVAIYQVETLPGGSGEIGEVSVRFRDTAAGQMVERTWAIPHDAKAPAIDRATPPMQLAVLSMFAAEKLKGGPLADAIDFKQLVDSRANVRRFYGNTGRSAEMLRMIDAIK